MISVQFTSVHMRGSFQSSNERNFAPTATLLLDGGAEQHAVVNSGLRKAKNAQNPKLRAVVSIHRRPQAPKADGALRCSTELKWLKSACR